jgi:HD-GYP domain-containing protein (c-di-GMP phosphodiesterase class II)
VKKHSDQVSRFGDALRKLGLSDKQIELILKARLLHDVGKLGIPDAILNKRCS